MDPVNKKALKGDFKDRADKDIDNDGKVDSTDKYLHARRKAVSKAIAKEEVELDEISQDVKNRYIKKADVDYNKSFKSGDYKRMKKRLSGLAKATKDFKEEVEQIDEISADLARRVSSKRNQQAVDLHRKAQDQAKSGQLMKSLATGDKASEKEAKAAKAHSYSMKALDRVKKMKESTYLHKYIKDKDDV